MYNIGEILKIDIVMAVTTQTIEKGDQTWSCVELVLMLVWNMYNLTWIDWKQLEFTWIYILFESMWVWLELIGMFLSQVLFKLLFDCNLFDFYSNYLDQHKSQVLIDLTVRIVTTLM